MVKKKTISSEIFSRGILILLFMVAFLGSYAQDDKQINHKLTTKTVVKDSLGNQYSYATWQQMLVSGDYTLVPVNPEASDTHFIIKKLSSEEKESRFAAMPKPVESEAFKTGTKFQPFNATDINGNRYKLDEMKGKVVVLNFWFVNCPPCRLEIPHLNKLVSEYAHTQDIIFLAIALDNKKKLDKFLSQMPFTYRIIDNGRNLADKYGVRSFPTHVVIDKEGMVRFHTSGLAIHTLYWIKKSITEALGNTVEAKSGANASR